MSTRVAAALLLCLAACGGSGEAPAPRGPNLIVITMDTLRSDHLGCYGYHRDTSPALDALAARSLVFERCYAPIPRTAPSHTSLFTGVYPYEHGITQNIGRRLVDEIVAGDVAAPESSLRTLPEWMKARRYATGGFVSATPVKKATGISSGFDAWSEPTDHRRSAEAVNAALIPWLEEVSEPFFLWGH